jgi:peptide/nickel transport system substrate-binding protein
MSLLPGLATEWNPLDETTWELKLREGVRFHDGQEFSARDVKASIELASGYAGEAASELAMASWWIPHEVEVVDDLTVRLRSEQPFGPLLRNLSLVDIVCAEDVAEGLKKIEESPNGTGAYRLAEDAPSRKTLEAFEDYHASVPSIRTVVWEFVPDATTRLNALLGGQADIVEQLDPDQLQVIERRDDVDLQAVTSHQTRSLYFRMDKEPFGTNAALRRAVAWGLDREQLTNIVGSRAQLATSHWASGVQYHQPQEPVYRFDPERARAELRSAEVDLPIQAELIGSVGVYAKSEEVCELIAENLGEIGIDVKLNLQEVGGFLDALFSEGVSDPQKKPGDFIHNAFGNLTADPDFSVNPLYGRNPLFTGIKDERAASLVEKGRTLPAESAERRETYLELQRYLWGTLLPDVPLMYNPFSIGFAAQVDGLKLYPTTMTRFSPVEGE